MATTDRAEADRRFFAQAGRGSWLSVCVVAGVSLLAWWWLAPALTLGLRNDDFLIPYYLDSETGAVRWPRVFEELFRGWFGAPELYRPMVSLSLALEYSWTGLLPSLHLGNVLMVTVAAAATASLAMRLVASDVTGSPDVVALGGQTFFVIERGDRIEDRDGSGRPVGQHQPRR